MITGDRRPELLHRNLSAWLIGGFARTELSLHWRVSDPVAVRLALRTATGWEAWHVARSVLGNGVMGVPADPEFELARVAVTRLAAVPPAPELALVVLRGRRARWQITVNAAELAAFVAETYDACSMTEEQQRVDDETDVWLRFFSVNQETETGNGNE